MKTDSTSKVKIEEFNSEIKSQLEKTFSHENGELFPSDKSRWHFSNWKYLKPRNRKDLKQVVAVFVSSLSYRHYEYRSRPPVLVIWETNSGGFLPQHYFTNGNVWPREFSFTEFTHEMYDKEIEKYLYLEDDLDIIENFEESEGF